MYFSESVGQRAKAIADRAPFGGRFVEVGTLHGHLAYAVHVLRPDLSVVMVDNWLPMEEQPHHYVNTKDDHALHTAAQVKKNENKARRVANNIGACVVKLDSVKAANVFEDASQSLVFIDADHSYEGCNADIAAWTPKVEAGGWIGGHDYRNPDPRFGGVDRAVDEAFPEGVETAENYTWWVQVQ